MSKYGMTQDPRTYGAACPHCGHTQNVTLKGLFASPKKGKKGVVCGGKEGCGMPFTVAWKDGEGVEVRRER